MLGRGIYLILEGHLLIFSVHLFLDYNFFKCTKQNQRKWLVSPRPTKIRTGTAGSQTGGCHRSFLRGGRLGWVHGLRYIRRMGFVVSEVGLLCLLCLFFYVICVNLCLVIDWFYKYSVEALNYFDTYNIYLILYIFRFDV